MKRFAPVLLCVVCIAAPLSCPTAAQAQGSIIFQFKLSPGSTYQTGCFPPCTCPLSEALDLTGTFTLRCTCDSIGTLIQYAVTDVAWTVAVPGSPDPPISITGSGTYITFTEFGEKNQMHLDLSLVGEPGRRFDTFIDFVGSIFPKINSALTLDRMSCQDTVIHVIASPLGACCPDGPAATACIVATEAECDAMGGAYQGDASPCPSDPTAACGTAEAPPFNCPSAPCGACCGASAALEPSCFETTEAECAAVGGTSLPGGGCEPVLCDATPVACCQTDGTCADLDISTCAARGGVAFDPSVLCGAVNCASVVAGACCPTDPASLVRCFTATPGGCAFVGGTYQGDGSACPADPVAPCTPPTGGCCFPTDDPAVSLCDVMSIDDCMAASGVYQGDDTTCDPPACNCCFPNRTCTTMPPAVCAEVAATVPPIPAVSTVGVAVMTLLFVVLGMVVISRRSVSPASR